MGKKTPTPATETPKYFDEYKAGTRKCPSCEKYTVGPKSTVCANPACKKPFPATKTATTSKPSTVAPTITRKANFADTIKTLAKVKEFVAKYRQAETALELITALETLVNDCDGFDGVKEAIKVLPDLK